MNRVILKNGNIMPISFFKRTEYPMHSEIKMLYFPLHLMDSYGVLIQKSFKERLDTYYKDVIGCYVELKRPLSEVREYISTLDPSSELEILTILDDANRNKAFIKYVYQPVVDLNGIQVVDQNTGNPLYQYVAYLDGDVEKIQLLSGQGCNDIRNINDPRIKSYYNPAVLTMMEINI